MKKTGVSAHVRVVVILPVTERDVCSLAQLPLHIEINVIHLVKRMV